MATPTLEERMTGMFGQIAALDMAVAAIYHMIPDPQRLNVLKRFDYLNEVFMAELLNAQTGDEFVEQTRRFTEILRNTLEPTELITAE